MTTTVMTRTGRGMDELDDLLENLDEGRSWEPKRIGDSLAGYIEAIGEAEKRGYMILVRDRDGTLWKIHGVARDIRDAVREYQPEVGYAMAIRYEGSGTTERGAVYRRFAVGFRGPQ